MRRLESRHAPKFDTNLRPEFHFAVLRHLSATNPLRRELNKLIRRVLGYLNGPSYCRAASDTTI